MDSDTISVGQPPFSPVSDDDQAGNLWTVTILGFIYSSMAAMLRGHIKWRIYGVDDYFLAAAVVRYVLLTGMTIIHASYQ
jgi:hypothetical protein